MCGKQPPYFIPHPDGETCVFSFRASKISRYSLKYWGLLGFIGDDLPAAYLIRNLLRKGYPHFWVDPFNLIADFRP